MGFLRLWLAVMVLAAHGFIPPFFGAGTLAVECFFVISGFYMQMIIAERYAHQPDWILRFYESRLLRIYAPYWVILALVVGAGLFLPVTPMPQPASISTLLMNLFIIGSEHIRLLHMAADCQQAGADIMAITVAWSIGMELLFYAIAPFLLTRFFTTVLVTVISLGAKAYFLTTQFEAMVALPCWDGFLNNIFPLEIGVFTLGALTYRFYRRFLKQYSLTRQHFSACYIGIIAVISYTFLLKYIFSQPVHQLIVGYYLFVALIACSTPFLFAATRTVKWDRAIGELSYSFYLLHVFVLTSLRLTGLGRNEVFILTLLITLVCAGLMVRFVEHPLARWRHRLFRHET